jgi:DNA-binding transcriptional ArsR family regulator
MSNKETMEESEPVRRARVPTPLQPISAINKAVIALYSYKKPVMYKDISNAVGMHPVNVSQALSSSRDIGLTELSGKKGLYILTNQGREYARLLTAGKESEARNLIRELLRANPIWVDIIAFLDATRGQSRDPIDLALEIERRSGKQWKQIMRNRIRDSLVSILDFSEMIVKEGSKVIAVEGKQTIRIGEAELVVPERYTTKPANIPSPLSSDDSFASLRGDDFTFEVRKDLNVITFAKRQFSDWIEYIEKNLKEKKQENRQSDGVPNQ